MSDNAANTNLVIVYCFHIDCSVTMGEYFIHYSCYSSNVDKVISCSSTSNCTVPFCFHVAVVDICEYISCQSSGTNIALA